MQFGINWNGWHTNCGCPARKDAYRNEDITVDGDTKTAVSDAVDVGAIGVADAIIDAWVKSNVDPRATWKWAREMNTLSFSPSGRASITRQQKIRRDAITVTVPWCTAPMFAAVRPWGR